METFNSRKSHTMSPIPILKVSFKVCLFWGGPKGSLSLEQWFSILVIAWHADKVLKLPRHTFVLVAINKKLHVVVGGRGGLTSQRLYREGSSPTSCDSSAGYFRYTHIYLFTVLKYCFSTKKLTEWFTK